MSFVLTVKSRKRRLELIVGMAGKVGDIQWKVAGQVSARCCPRFVTAIRTVAEIIVYGGKGNLDRRVGDTREGGTVFVELGNCRTRAMLV